MISAAELRAWVGATAADDAILTELEAAAVAHAQRVTGRFFGEPTSATEIVPGTGGRRLYLADLPALVDEAYDVAVEYGEVGADLAADADWVLRTSGTEAWLERTDGGVWSDDYEYHVTYTRGFTAGGEPADLRRFVIAFVAEAWNLRGMEGKLSESMGGYQVSLTSKVTDRGNLDRMLDPWKRPVVA